MPACLRLVPLLSWLVASLLPFAAQAAPATACTPSVEMHRRIVQEFYRTGLIDRQPRAAFMRFMAPDFVEHKPDVAGGTREAVADYLEALMKAVPEPRWEILRTVAEGDLVFLHARFTPAPGAAPYAIADLFRLKDCRIVEHWDVVAGPPEKQLNPNPRF